MASSQRSVKTSVTMSAEQIRKAREAADCFISAGLAHRPSDYHGSVAAKPLRRTKSASGFSEVKMQHATARDIAAVKRLVDKLGKQKLFAMIRQAG